MKQEIFTKIKIMPDMKVNFLMLRFGRVAPKYLL